MDEEKNEKKQDEQTKSNILQKGRDIFKKPVNKFVMAFKKIAAIIAAMPVIMKVVIIVAIVAVVLSVISTITSLFNSGSAAGTASMSVIQNEVTLAESTTGEGYYFKIDQNILDKYIEETYYAEQEGTDWEKGITDIDEGEEVDDEEEEEDVDIDEYDNDEKAKMESKLEDFFKIDNFEEYFVKMIRSEIASTYPKLGDYTGKNGTEDGQGNKKDNEGNYVAQGIVKIHRQQMNKDGSVGSEAELEYIPHDQFTALVNANDASALNYFAFDESSGLIYYATYYEKIVTVDGVETSREYTLRESSASYKAVTAMCSMPYNFLFALLETSNNPNYVMAVADLLLEESDVVLMIQDQLSVSTLTEVNRQVERTDSTPATGHEDTIRVRKYD